MADVDFDIEVKFESQLSSRIQLQGVLVEESLEHFGVLAGRFQLAQLVAHLLPERLDFDHERRGSGEHFVLVGRILGIPILAFR